MGNQASRLDAGLGHATGRQQARRLTLLAAVLMVAGCASAPPPPPAAPVVTIDQQIAAIIRLEDLRVLEDPDPPAPVPAPVVTRRGAVVAPAPPPPVADLRTYAADPDPRVRRRTAVALGRVGLAEGRAPLEALLGDGDAEVRRMAAFGLGLLGDRTASPALVARLGSDPDLLVRARAAEALGLIGATEAAGAIADLVRPAIASGAVAGQAADDLGVALTPELEAFRLALYALVRLKAADRVLATVTDGRGQPVARWWPIAFALRRLDDPRALAPLIALLRGEGSYTAAFAAQGLGFAKQPDIAVPPLVESLASPTPRPAVRIQAVRALGRLKDPRGVAPLLPLLAQRELDPALRLEVVAALGALEAAPAFDPLLDLLSDPWPALRAEVVRALAAIDPEGFIRVLSGIDPDPDWTVRAATVAVLGTLGPDAPASSWQPYLADPDRRVMPALLRALVAAKVPDAGTRVLAALGAEDSAIRSTAATLLATLKPEGAVPALAAAFTAARNDPDSGVRVSVLDALVAIRAEGVRDRLTEALGDRDWAVRLKARSLLRDLDPAAAAEPQRPAMVRLDRAVYDSLATPSVSPRVFIDTAKGSVEVALAVLEAPLTTHNFTTLARRGYFNGLRLHRVVPDFVVQDGDPRGDGTGGPGYTIRDELNELAYLRGTVGMALSGPDTGGSQFFITHSPQPHLDAKYTVFGRVVSGMEVVDRLLPGDVIERIRVWDGVTMSRR